MSINKSGTGLICCVKLLYRFHNVLRVFEGLKDKGILVDWLNRLIKTIG
jgi:hypothetical protein